jgi:hypothetical protein
MEPRQEERSDPKVVSSVVNSVFRGIAGSEKHAYLKFLAASIESLLPKYSSRWGITLFEHQQRIRLNVGWVEALALDKNGLRVLVDKKSSPHGIKLDDRHFRNAPGCDIAPVPINKLTQVLPSLISSHQMAVAVAAKRNTNESIRQSHSPGIIRFLSEFIQRPLPDPSYALPVKLHLLNGGYGNGDKELLEKTVKHDCRAKSWVVPKSASVGDDVVINVADCGLFAVGKIASRTKPRRDWKNRYGADLNDIQLIDPPIPLAEVQRFIPELKWTRYPRSITTPTPEIAEKIRGLISVEKARSRSDIPRANPTEIMNIASLELLRPTTKIQRLIYQRIRSAKVRKAVLERASGICEGCEKAAPFKNSDGLPFLETHHTKRVAEDGPDDPRYVIALCPNCHRRTEYGEDAKSFNATLARILTNLYSRVEK